MNNTDPFSSLREEYTLVQDRKRKTSQTKLLIDTASLVFQVIFRLRGDKRCPDKQKNSSCMSKDEEEFILKFFKSTFMKTVKFLKKKYNADEVILARDVNRETIWRMKIFENYKTNRKMVTRHKGENIAFANIFIGIYNTNVYQEIVKELDVLSIKVDTAEADDIIAVLSKQFVLDNHSVVIIADDYDYYQLLSFPNIEIYNNAGENFLSINDGVPPKGVLRSKILRGDRSDNIPSCQILLSKYQNLTEYTFEDIELLIKMGIIDKKCISSEMANELKNNIELIEKLLSEDPLFYQTFLRNSMLIDMNNIPNEISKTILEKYYTLKNQKTSQSEG